MCSICALKEPYMFIACDESRYREIASRNVPLQSSQIRQPWFLPWNKRHLRVAGGNTCGNNAHTTASHRAASEISFG